MFGQWRLTLQQAEQALRSERFDEALELVRRPEVVEHRHAGELRDRIALRLVERADEQLRRGHSQAAWRDLRQAELAGAPCAKVESVRTELVERGVAEARSALDAGSPTQAATLIEELKERGADATELRRLHDGAVAWRRALQAIAAGEFSRAAADLELAAKRIGDCTALAQKQKWFEHNRARAMNLKTRLQDALVAKEWPEVLRAADSFLEIAPDCREVRNSRDEAMRRLGVKVAAETVHWKDPAGAENAPPVRGAADARNGQRGRLILWVDGAGGYLVCLGSSVSVGQANPGSSVDIPILGDLSRNHAMFIRDGEGYLIKSDREMSVNGRAARESSLRDGDVIRLGRSVEMKFSKPCPVSETARLVLVSRHRLHLSLAGILLMADTCVLGQSSQTHVQVAGASGQAVLYRQGDTLWCRGDGEILVDGQACQGRGPLRLPSRAVIGELSFSLEPLSLSLV
jgi:hypothetical protein